MLHIAISSIEIAIAQTIGFLKPFNKLNFPLETLVFCKYAPSGILANFTQRIKAMKARTVVIIHSILKDCACNELNITRENKSIISCPKPGAQANIHIKIGRLRWSVQMVIIVGTIAAIVPNPTPSKNLLNKRISKFGAKSPMAEPINPHPVVTKPIL